MNYELTVDEKKLIAQKRLNELDAGFSRSGTDVTMFQMNNGDINLSMVYNAGKVDEVATSVAISDEDAAQLFIFLKKRYELKKELEYLNTPAKEPCPKKVAKAMYEGMTAEQRAEMARKEFKF